MKYGAVFYFVFKYMTVLEKYMAKPCHAFSFFPENVDFPQFRARQPGTETFPGSSGIRDASSAGLNAKGLV